MTIDIKANMIFPYPYWNIVFTPINRGWKQTYFKAWAWLYNVASKLQENMQKLDGNVQSHFGKLRVNEFPLEENIQITCTYLSETAKQSTP